MTKSKKKQKKRGALASASGEASGFASQKQKQNIDALIDEAQSAIDSFTYDEAIEKLKDVLNSSPNHEKALEMLAGVYIEQSDWNEAQNLLKQCVTVSPDTGYTKYFSLGQLTDGEESVSFYQKGIEILQKELENCENLQPAEETDKKVLMKDLSNAYCSISETYMTDLCFAENSEQHCVSAIELAIQADPSNSEAHQCKANYHLVKEEFDEAKTAMEKSLSLWLPHHEALRDADTEAILNSTEVLIPSYDSRIQTAKMLIELEMFDQATNILDGLVEEDDEVTEVWYILGWMNYIQGDEYKLNAHYYLKKAKEVSVKLGVRETDYNISIYRVKR
ncbi:putative assembly chaperone of rpl4 like protein [Argiope bruennichi]|uniref:Putative assembly chaperone of rpl4 like protein n=1 Tax=Argiope bruennichi TaxID=94029 RepID=A0A8T0G1N4_ARGBR|nr:putative assembly chaperone of rpl4 like protein [Argiope bruennichi]